jgi:hypothetical protein
MGISLPYRETATLDFTWNEITGAVGDSVTVLPIVVAVAVLTELSLALMLVWFGVFQIVWGLYYGVPVSVEPMKALAALILAGTISAGEFLIAGVLLGVVLVVLGASRALTYTQHYIGEPVVRGIQLGVALVLLETGVSLGLDNLLLTGVGAVLVVVVLLSGYGNLSAFLVLIVGGVVALFQTGIPAPSLPTMVMGVGQFTISDLTVPALEATVAQLGMTVGNAALATSVLLADYFDREVSPDELAGSMGVMNLLAVPLGGIPMCHGSGGVAGKYAFGARTAGANVILGVGYVLVAFVAVDLVAAYPVAVLGVILAVIAAQLGLTSVRQTDAYLFVVGIGVLGLVVNLGIAFLAGVVAYNLRRYWNAS